MRWHSWSLSQGLLHLGVLSTLRGGLLSWFLEQGDTLTTVSSFCTSHTLRSPALPLPARAAQAQGNAPFTGQGFPSTFPRDSHLLYIRNGNKSSSRDVLLLKMTKSIKKQSQALLSAATAAKHQQRPGLQRHGTGNSLLSPLRTQDHTQLSPAGFSTSFDGCRLS